MMAEFMEFLSTSPILTGAWVVLFVMLIMNVVGNAVSKVKEVSTHDATLMMNREDAVLLDIRKQDEYRNGHILGPSK